MIKIKKDTVSTSIKISIKKDELIKKIVKDEVIFSSKNHFYEVATDRLIKEYEKKDKKNS